MGENIQTGRPVEILLIEDNLGDIELTRQGLIDGKILNNLSVVTNGNDAMPYLHREGDYADVTKPDLILLDLNLPGKDGREILDEIRRDEKLANIPVAVLTASDMDADILKAYKLKAYKLKANCYVTKPVDFEKFAEIVHQLDQFCFTIAERAK
jgi:two-component system response regulator